jgi:hypothetical protein
MLALPGALTVIAADFGGGAADLPFVIAYKSK